MPDRPTPQPGVLKIAPYVPGRSKASGAVQTIKLSSNESPLGASPKAMAALADIATGLASYPEGSSAELRETLAAVHGLEAKRIMMGAGSDEILHLLSQTYLGDGDEAVIGEYGFLVYPITTQAAGGTPVYAKSRDYQNDVDAMLAAVTEKTKIVFLDNPNNPTGTYLSDSEVRRLHAGLRPDILLVIDNAYAEYVTALDYRDGTDLVREADNVVMVRTFSKMGLAALRLGWMYGPDHIIDAVNRIRGPFNVNAAAQAAGVAAAKDREFTALLSAHNAEWRAWLTAELSSNALRVLPSEGNFVLVLFPEQAGVTAADADAALLKEGVVARQVGAYGIGNGLRISIGTEAAMRKVADVLKAFMAEHAGV